MNPIGGYFELELRKGEEYHKDAIRLNSGRNAFEYILRSKVYKKVYLPYFICDVMLEPINKLNLRYEFYHINEQFEPVFDFSTIGKNETFIYTNYFGINGNISKKLSKICPNLIIDNSQAFFEKPIKGVDTFYSPRKFFGVPDGAYLYTDKYLQKVITHDKSETRFLHLIKRIDEGAEAGYVTFKANDEGIKGQPIKLMSALTQALLCNIDYVNAISVRKQNFLYLHETLKEVNKLKLPNILEFVPMVYPYWTDNKDLRNSLIKNNVFVAQYWPNVLEWCELYQLETKMTKEIIYLPIDQRYMKKEMKFIISQINNTNYGI